MTPLAAVQVIVVDNASSKPAMAKINSIAQMTATAVRALAPMAVSSLYALSAGLNILGGYMVYIVLLLALGIGARNALLLPRDLKNLKSRRN